MKRLLTNTFVYAIAISACEFIVGTFLEGQLLLGYIITFIVSIAVLTFLLSFRPIESYGARFSRAFLITSIAALIITTFTLSADLINTPDYFDTVREEALTEQDITEINNQYPDNIEEVEEVFDIIFSPGFIITTTILLYFVTGFFISLITAGLMGVSSKENHDQVFDEHLNDERG